MDSHLKFICKTFNHLTRKEFRWKKWKIKNTYPLISLYCSISHRPTDDSVLIRVSSA